MTDAELIRAVGLVVFVGLLAAGFASTALRMWRLWRAKVARPALIWRDMIERLLYLGVVVIAFTHAMLGYPWRDEPGYVALTSLLACGAAGVYLYYELVIIGHRRDRR